MYMYKRIVCIKLYKYQVKFKTSPIITWSQVLNVWYRCKDRLFRYTSKLSFRFQQLHVINVLFIKIVFIHSIYNMVWLFKFQIQTVMTIFQFLINSKKCVKLYQYWNLNCLIIDPLVIIDPKARKFHVVC